MSIEHVDRSAIIVRPAQPMLDWIHKVLAEVGEPPLRQAEVEELSNVYLIPVLENERHVERYVSRRAVDIFETELRRWRPEKELWPGQSGAELFSTWFDWELHDVIYDLESSPLEKIEAEIVEPFDLDADLRDSEGNIDRDLAGRWLEDLYFEFELSPELDEFQEAQPFSAVGRSQSLFDYLFTNGGSIRDVTPAILERVLFEHYPPTVVNPLFVGTPLVDEFRSLLEFLHRRYGLEHGEECIAFLSDPTLPARLEAAVHDEKDFSDVKSVLSSIGVIPKLKEVEEPFEHSEPKVGRNDPCPCGSGQKHKKCCL